MTSKKYLVTGDTQGRFKELYLKIVELNKKNGPFDAWFCFGDQRTEDENERQFLENLVNGELEEVPLPIYFVFHGLGLISKSEKVTLLNGSSAFVLPEGTKVGILEDLNQIEKFEENLLSIHRNTPCRELDILFTKETPSAVKKSGSEDSLGNFLAKLAPRYHFTSQGEDEFVELAPFENLDETGDLICVTRFVSLAKCFSPNAKWIYAFNLEPANSASEEILKKRPTNTTPNIYKFKESDLSVSSPNYFFQVDLGSKRSASELPTSTLAKKPRPGYICKACHSSEHFFRDCPHKDAALMNRPEYICHICHEPGHKIQNCPKKTSSGTGNTPVPSACWFCLANPAIRKHLIVEVWDEVYLTLAKGGLNPEHLIIIPIEHTPSNTDVTGNLKLEMDSKMEKINTYFKSTEQALCYFAIHHNPVHHLHYQIVGIPITKTQEFRAFALKFSEDKGYPLTINNHDGDEIVTEFRIGLFGTEIKFKHQIENNFFPANFGRELVATFLGLENRIDWRLSPLSEDEERALVKEWKDRLL